eukprot:TRINITY_DN32563_c0_g1_i1.p1 TRINITY_DN32563_c0_g1~~TRINITY_DN32563_c0_g1_i1.p1  ORF type:complete len:353 (-),score=30.76 TRINITY_DN32563_c0_g1_i1:132-1169(-)
MASFDVFARQELARVLLRFTGLFVSVRALRAAARAFRTAIDHVWEREPVDALVICCGMGGMGHLDCGDDTADRDDRSVVHLDLISGEWRLITELPAAHYGAAGAPCNGKIYVFGGMMWGVDHFKDPMDPMDSAVEYNPVTQTWTVLPPVANERFGAVAAGLHGNIFVCGGLASRGGEAEMMQETYSVERFFPSEGETFMRTPGSIPRCGHQGVVPVSGKWTSMPPMSVRRDTPVAVALADKIVVVGGSSTELERSPTASFDVDCEADLEVAYPGHALRSAEAFDPRTMEWTPMRVPRTGAAGVRSENRNLESHAAHDDCALQRCSGCCSWRTYCDRWKGRIWREP